MRKTINQERTNNIMKKKTRVKNETNTHSKTKVKNATKMDSKSKKVIESSLKRNPNEENDALMESIREKVQAISGGAYKRSPEAVKSYNDSIPLKPSNPEARSESLSKSTPKCFSEAFNQRNPDNTNAPLNSINPIGESESVKTIKTEGHSEAFHSSTPLAKTEPEISEDMGFTVSSKYQLRAAVRSCYDQQKLRIEMGNRIAANFRIKLGLDSSDKEESDKEANNILNEIREAYSKITEGLVEGDFLKKSKFKSYGIITNYNEYCLVGQYVETKKNEERSFKKLEVFLEEFDVYNKYLKNVNACGPAMCSVLISEIDIEKATYPSSLWALAGMDVAPDGRGRSKRKEHLVEREYIDREGKKQTKMSITFKPFLKSKLYVLGTGFIRQNKEYKAVYDGYKNRLENHPVWKDRTKLHRHNASIRYMIKIFLLDLYKNWREIDGLPVSKPYHETKLGIVHRKKA